MTTKNDYHPAIERLAQQFWSDNKTFEVSEELNKEKFYCPPMPPNDQRRIE